MFAIDHVTMAHGVSHMVAPSAEKFRIKTKEGIEYLKQKSKSYLSAKQHGAITVYQKFLEDELQEINTALYAITDDNKSTLKMDKETDEGWTEYNRLMEEFTVCSYFLNRCKNAL